MNNNQTGYYMSFAHSNLFADRIIDFNNHLCYKDKLPSGFEVINPFMDNPETINVMQTFYQKYYNDNTSRKFIIGINPSRNGAGITGIPFTDTKRLEQVCGITMHSAHTHEVSSVFMYDMIAAYGGADIFYKTFYINSPFPLAIVRKANNGTFLNANYYDEELLFKSVKPFMIKMLKKQIAIGLDTSEVFILGKKNASYIQKINKEEKLFEKLSILEHPRYIQQYKSKEKEMYIDKYILTLEGNK